MRSELDRRIERHLDTHLGLWTRLLPWREELATHIEENYLSRSVEEFSSIDEVCWAQSIGDFGDLKQIATQMGREHVPQYWAWRLASVAAAIGVVVWLIGPYLLFDATSLAIVALPAVMTMLFDASGGSVRWQTARGIGVHAALAGAILGGATMLFDLENPFHLGRCMAVSLLSSLYGLVLYTPGRWLSIAFVSNAMFVFVVLMLSFATYHNIPFRELYDNLGRIEVDWGSRFAWTCLLIVVTVVTSAVARFGLHRSRRHAMASGAIAFLLCIITTLQDMSEPNMVSNSILMSLLAAGTTVVTCHVLHDAAHAARRRFAV
ncbi:MAG: hypothetical protein AAF989_06445 [Planctomycetota bacterium]